MFRRDEAFIKSSNKSLLLLLLLVSGDIEMCPSPLTGHGVVKKVLQSRGIKVFHQNCRGLYEKVANLKTLFSGQKNTIITLSETHIESYSEFDNEDL